VQVAVDVAADLERSQQATESSSAAAMERRELIYEPLHGYAADTITRDRRFRAQEAFRARGVLRTKYAQDALARIQRAMPQRVDTLTSGQREELATVHR
jgi:hypothetical protein